MSYWDSIPGDNRCMKIVTINLPEKHIKAIEKICKIGRGGHVPEEFDFPSRSEFVRVAVREALIKYLDFYDRVGGWNNEPIKTTLQKILHFNGNQNKKVIVPEVVENNFVKEFKIHKIVKRLEYNVRNK